MTDLECCDRVLVMRAQSGELGAFNALVRKYRRRVMKLSMRYIRNYCDAEDSVQITFIKAYQGLRHFRGDAAFYSWLHCIAVNSAKTVLAHRTRELQMFSSGIRDDASQDETPGMLQDLDTPEKLALTDEISGVLNAAIERLSAEQRTAIVLRELQGLSYAQMAVEMDCPVGTVRSRVFRAREAINDQLMRVFDGGLSR